MKCAACGTEYPSRFHFYGNGETSWLVCLACSESLREEEKVKLKAEAESKSAAKGTSVGGWLSVWVFMTMIIIVGAFYGTFFITVRALSAGAPAWVWGALLYDVLFCAFTWYAVIDFTRQRRRARVEMIVLLLANVAFWAIGMTILDKGLVSLSDFWEQEVIQAIVGSVVMCLFWIPYFLVSRRAKRTFVR